MRVQRYHGNGGALGIHNLYISSVSHCTFYLLLLLFLFDKVLTESSVVICVQRDVCMIANVYFVNINIRYSVK